jgi:hypothetical protein
MGAILLVSLILHPTEINAKSQIRKDAKQEIVNLQPKHGSYSHIDYTNAEGGSTNLPGVFASLRLGVKLKPAVDQYKMGTITLLHLNLSSFPEGLSSNRK